MDDLLSDFIAETRETLDAIASEIVAWEAAPDDRERLDSIFRFVHTVKGSCGFLDLPRLQRLSHAAEDVLADVRSGKRHPDSKLVTAVLAVVDRIGELTDAMASGEPLPDGEDNVLIAGLSAEAAPAAAAVPAAAVPQPSRVLARSIRLPTELLDRMMAGVSDMVLARNELARRLRESSTDTPSEVAFERLSQCIAEMREAITRSRMARIDALFSTLPRMVRDLAGELGKQIVLEVDGGDVELDREMIEMIRDPLTHIVRNAIDHGIEDPDTRRAAGKPIAGRLRVSARQSGNQILIEAADDGRGIDDEKLVAKAVASGIISFEQGERMPRARRLELVFAAGLSTARAVTEVSGRGVGMDVVRANIERIGGTVDLDSRLGHGLKLTMCVPLTLTIIPALTVSSGGHRFAIPRSAIDELVRMGGEGVRTESIAGSAIARIRDARLPLIDLATFLGLPTDVCGGLFVALRAGGGERFVLAVDAVHDHEELVVKPAAPELMATGIYAGTTLPDNSRPMLLLDVAGIAAKAGIVAGERGEEQEAPAEVAATAPTLLFRDLDAVVRAVRLSLTDRIEDVAREDIFTSGGTLRLAHDDRVTLLVAAGPLPDAGNVRLLQLNDGASRLAYAIGEVLDIVALPEILPSADIAAGVTLIEGRPVELLDVHGLFAAGAAGNVDKTQPLCLIADAEDLWARQVLAPLLGAAGYRVSFAGEGATAAADVVIAAAGASLPNDHKAPVVRLRSEVHANGAGDDSIYRYDRHALLGALSRQVGARA